MIGKKAINTITSSSNGRSKDITVNALSKRNIKSIVIGTGIALVGMAYMGLSCFFNGAKEYDREECNVFYDLDLAHQDVIEFDMGDHSTEP